MDGSELAVLAAYQNNLVSAENDDVRSGSMSPNSNVRKYESSRERVKLKELFHVFFMCVLCLGNRGMCSY